MKVFFILSWALMFVFLLNIVLYQMIKWRTLKRYVIPYMKLRGNEILDVKFKGFPDSRIWKGYLDLGDFGEKKIAILPVSVMGNMLLDTYMTVYAKNNNGSIAKYTLKVCTIFFLIKKVEIRGNGIAVVINE